MRGFYSHSRTGSQSCRRKWQAGAGVAEPQSLNVAEETAIEAHWETGRP
jgi:hypothetical protein